MLHLSCQIDGADDVELINVAYQWTLETFKVFKIDSSKYLQREALETEDQVTTSVNREKENLR